MNVSPRGHHQVLAALNRRRPETQAAIPTRRTHFRTISGIPTPSLPQPNTSPPTPSCNAPRNSSNASATSADMPASSP